MRRQRGNGIYLIPFATKAFVPQRQNRPSKLPSLSVFPVISTDFTPTPQVPFASVCLNFDSFLGAFPVRQENLTKDLSKRLRTLHAQ